jgi:hypothetical protein
VQADTSAFIARLGDPDPWIKFETVTRTRNTAKLEVVFHPQVRQGIKTSSSGAKSVVNAHRCATET